MVKLTEEEINKLRKIFNKEPKKKIQFNKGIVMLIVSMNIIFTAVIVFLYYKTGSEPSTLIDRWFKFTGTELVVLGGIKGVDTLKEMIEIWRG